MLVEDAGATANKAGVGDDVHSVLLYQLVPATEGGSVPGRKGGGAIGMTQLSVPAAGPAKGSPKRIEVRGLTKIFGSGAEEALALASQGASRAEILDKANVVVAVHDVSFSVEQGEIFVVVGLSGSGKSTLVRCLNRLHEPSAGSIEIDGEDIVGADEESLRALRLNKVAMVFQHFALLPHRTVAENVEYGLKMRGLDKTERRRKALDVLKSVGLAAWADQLPSALSGGMQQRVGLARALALDPEILLMDEPFSALDPLIRRDMQQELLELQRRYRTTIIFITHDLNEALTLGDRVAVMKDGRFVQVGRPAQIVSAPADDYVANFIRDIDRGRVLPVSSASVTAAATAKAGTSVASAHQMLKATEGQAIVVVDADGRPLGLATRGDIQDSPGDMPVENHMRRDFVAVEAASSLFSLCQRMKEPLPAVVLDKSGRAIGLIDALSVMSAIGGSSASEGRA